MQKREEVERLFAETEKAFGPANVLVNNAGVYAFGGLDDIDEEHFHRQFDINVLGLLLASQAAARHFGEKGGSIINIGSIASAGRMPQAAVYAGTKAAVDAITNVLSIELAPRNIRVNSVNPGYVPTEGNAFFAGTEMETEFIKKIPLQRSGKTHEIGNAVVFLASDDAVWITGELLRVSGGAQ